MLAFRACRHRLSALKMTHGSKGLALFAVFVLLAVFIISALILFIYTIAASKCEMSNNLSNLLLYTVARLSSANIPFFLDYGSLLGAVRSHSVVPWEFDIDIGVEEKECERIVQLKQSFWEDKSFTLYGPKDPIPQKENTILGYDAYLHTPCVRIYDSSLNYYVDIYWYRLVTVESLKSINPPPPAIYFPPHYSYDDGDLLCNDEGFTGELPGGCRLYKHIFPLTTTELNIISKDSKGENIRYAMLVPIPAHSHYILAQSYGEDWQTPKPKGYKALVCSSLPDFQDSFSVTPYLFLIFIFVIPGYIMLLIARKLQLFHPTTQLPAPLSLALS